MVIKRVSELSLREATEFMKKLKLSGYDSWFKTVANKDKGELEVHIIVQDKYITILDNPINIEEVKNEF